MTRDVFESYLAAKSATDRARSIKNVAIYTRGFVGRRYGEAKRFPETEEDIVQETITRILAEWEGYLFRDGDILYHYYLCRCCRKTVLSLQRRYAQQKNQANALTANGPELSDTDESVADELTEDAALQFFHRVGRINEFLAFLERKTIRGKLRHYARRFVKYAEEGWSTEDIAADLKCKLGVVRTYRSRLRHLIQDFADMVEKRNDPMNILAGEGMAPGAPADLDNKTEKD
jgi:DNA-directed RNA polymerase specialized sigma24 family protein